MSTKLDFNHISFLYDWRIFLVWGVVTTDFIYRNTSGKGDPFEDLFFVVNFTQFFIDEIVPKDAEIKYFGANWYFFDEFC